MFDAIAFADDEGIDYVKSGKNIKRDCFGINCKNCGDDPSYHMNIANNGTSAKCFRCGKSYRGERAVIQLLRDDVPVSFSELQKILAEYYDFDDEKEIDQTENDVRRKKFQRLYNSFVSIDKDEYVRAYLRTRVDDTKRALKYGFVAGTELYKDRIVLPVKTPDGEVVTFAARSINKYVEPRYKNCPNDKSILPMSECLFGIDETLRLIKEYNWQQCLITEGAFDAWRLLEHDIPAVAVMKKTITQEQTALLNNVLSDDATLIVALDSTCTQNERNELNKQLNQFFETAILCYSGAKDIGEMSVKDIVRLGRAIRKTYSNIRK